MKSERHPPAIRWAKRIVAVLAVLCIPAAFFAPIPDRSLRESLAPIGIALLFLLIVFEIATALGIHKRRRVSANASDEQFLRNLASKTMGHKASSSSKTSPK